MLARRQSVDYLTDAALRAARASGDDTVAAASLRASAVAHRRAIGPALKTLQRMSASRPAERAYRLLESARTGAPVAPADPARIETIRREYELGTLPMGDAFARLVTAVPELGEIERDVRASRAADPDTRRKVREGLARRLKILGPKSRQRDPLLQSHLAFAVAFKHLLIAAGDTRHGDPTMPYFSAPTSVSTTIELRSGEPSR